MGHGKDGLGEELKVVRMYFSKLRLFTNYLRTLRTSPSSQPHWKCKDSH